ncbi:MAG: hypothetical protein HUU04_10690, partial [Verrucomicrobiae bacterium]|nr:hypothetical protein [Verrucomicrobiae bacterium]
LGDLDPAGKLVSLALWALAFWLNHRLLHRTLPPGPARWGDLLFALSPLSLFFGQAFMPEMLIMTLALGIVLAFLRYQETGAISWLILCMGISLVAVTVKANEVSHLFVLIAILAFIKEGWPCLIRGRYWVFVTLLALVTHLYGTYMTGVNAVSFPEWAGAELRRGFFGSLDVRMSWLPYARSFCYISLLLLTPAAAAMAFLGVLRIFRKRQAHLYLFWLLALVFFYMVWGPGTSFAHSYYNLPSLPVGCAFFGIGTHLTIAWMRNSLPRLGRLRVGNSYCAAKKAQTWVSAGILLLLVMGSAAGSLVLFWPDRSAREGARALKRIVAGRQGFVLCYPNHTAYGPGYIHYTTLFHCAGVRGWNENPKWSSAERARILEKCRWIIELRYLAEDQMPLRSLTIFSHRPKRLLNTQRIREDPAFHQVEECSRYLIWERASDSPRSSP